MSDLFGVAATVAVALVAATAKTTVQIQAVTNHRVKVTGWAVYFDGITSTAVPARARLVRQTTAGTMTALTLVKTASRPEALLTTGTFNASVEPTLGDVVDLALIHPQQGYEVKFTPGQEIVVGGGERIGIEVNAPAVVNVISKIFFEE